MTAVVGIVSIVLALIIGAATGFKLGAAHMLGRWNEKATNDGRFFFVRCPVCGNKVKCDTANLRAKLESETPWVDCNRCAASLIAPYMNHEIVRKARAEYQRLVIENKSMREILQEPHHPVKQEEEEALKKALAPPPRPTAASGALVVYSSNGPQQENSR